MSEKYEQCSEKDQATESTTAIATENQEVPSDLQSQQKERAEARMNGRTPSSAGLPRIDLELLTGQNKAQFTPAEGAPECKDAGESKAPVEDRADETPVSTEKDDSGRPVREKFASGPDVIVAYDEQGQAHRFVDEPIKKMPPDFSGIPEFRQKQLDGEAQDLIEKYGAKTAGDTDGLDFQKIADMQKEIAQRQDLTETEKCQLYTKAQQIMYDEKLPIQNWNEKPEMVDSWSGASDPWHAVCPLDDRYHNRLVNMTPEEASKAIREQEDHTEGDMHDSVLKRIAWKGARLVFDVNEGDVNASEGQVKAMRELREKGTFAAYAEEWEKQYVNKNAENPRDGQGGTR